MAEPCSGYCRSPISTKWVDECPYKAYEPVEGRWYCYFHLKVVRGLIKDLGVKGVGAGLKPLSWNPRKEKLHRTERAPGTLEQLVAEWLR